MKIVKILGFLMFLSTTLAAQRWEFGTDFNVLQPVGGMERTMDNAFGMNFFGARNLKAPFSVGLELGFNSYGSETTRQQYEFDDGTVTETDVVVTNNIFNVNITGKYFLRNSKKINPYLTGKLGFSRFSTNLTIQDPEDEFSCEPLESDVLYHDETLTASAGAGIRIDFSTVFKKVESQLFFLDLSFQTVQGGTVRYMNVDIDPSKPAPTRDVTAKFINTQTRVIHEHHVGYVYSGLVDMLQYRVGFICRPNFLSR